MSPAGMTLPPESSNIGRVWNEDSINLSDKLFGITNGFMKSVWGSLQKNGIKNWAMKL